MAGLIKRLEGKLHYGWIVLGAVFLALLLSAGARSTPGVLMLPWGRDLSWSRGTVSLAISVNIALYGLIGPFAAAAIQRYGVRRCAAGALAAIAFGAGLSAWMTAPWQAVLLWGVVVGGGTGLVALPLGAIIVNRWFAKHRGLAMGIFSASTATGQLVFLPLMAAIIERHGWRPVVWLVAAVAAAVVPVLLLLVPERPSDVGLAPCGAAHDAPSSQAMGPAPGHMAAATFGTLKRVAGHRDFQLLAFSFFVCGASANGFIGSHMLSLCADHGLPETRGAGLLATMGVFDLLGTTLSGWLSDRFNNNRLLFCYYFLRGIALAFLPYAFAFGSVGLTVFAVLYGLDWVATVPPTSRLISDIFGKEAAPVIFAWTLAAHQVGASAATLVAGLLRDTLGNYSLATLLSGGLCVVSAFAVLRIGKGRKDADPAVPVATANTVP